MTVRDNNEIVAELMRFAATFAATLYFGCVGAYAGRRGSDWREPDDLRLAYLAAGVVCLDAYLNGRILPAVLWLVMAWVAAGWLADECAPGIGRPPL